MSRLRSPSSQNFLSSIRGRFVSIVGLFVLGLIAMVAALTWMDAGDMYAGRRNELKAVIEVAYKTVEQQYNEFKSGKISESEAQERAKASLRAMRYDGNDYILVLNKDIFTIVHGARPDQEGVDHSQERDPTGKYISREIHDAAFAKGEAYVDYLYPKPGAASDRPSPKLTYGKLFATWEWVLCTGMYVDDVEATIWRRILINALSALGILAVIGGVIAAMMFRMSNRINVLNAAMKRLAAGERDVALLGPAGNDEIGDMARAVEIFKENAIERARLEAETAANRSTSEAERKRAAAERAKVAEEQAEVVRRLSAGLKDVADGDLMVRLSEGFSPAYARVRDDFNETEERRGGARSGRRDERDRQILAADQPNHRRHRRNRVPNEPAGPQRRRRGGARG